MEGRIKGPGLEDRAGLLNYSPASNKCRLNIIMEVFSSAIVSPVYR